MPWWLVLLISLVAFNISAIIVRRGFLPLASVMASLASVFSTFFIIIVVRAMGIIPRLPLLQEATGIIAIIIVVILIGYSTVLTFTVIRDLEG